MTNLERTEDIDLASLMTVDQAIERFPHFRRMELMAAMRAGRLRHWPKGRARLVTENWLKDYVRTQLRGGGAGHWQDGSRTSPNDSRSPDSGSLDTKPADDGSATGMTSAEEESAAGLLAQSISRKPKKSSPPTH